MKKKIKKKLPIVAIFTICLILLLAILFNNSILKKESIDYNQNELDISKDFLLDENGIIEFTYYSTANFVDEMIIGYKLLEFPELGLISLKDPQLLKPGINRLYLDNLYEYINLFSNFTIVLITDKAMFTLEKIDNNWVIDDKEKESQINNSLDDFYKDKNISVDLNETDYDRQDLFYILNYFTTEGGEIVGVQKQIVKLGEDGTSVFAKSNTNYKFSNWSDGRTDNPRIDHNVTSNKNIVANFIKYQKISGGGGSSSSILKYILIYLSGENGTISGENHQQINLGDNGTQVIAIPNTGYHFVNWSDGNTNSIRQDINVQEDITVTANFDINTYSVLFKDWNGDILKNEDVNYGYSATAPADPIRTDYTFTGWTPSDFTSIVSDLNIVANFEEDSSTTYTLTYIAGVGGIIDGNDLQYVNSGDDGNQVIAIPDVGRHFVNWADGNTNSTRQDINVQGDINVTANFDINTYALTYTAGSGGFIDGNTNQIVVFGGNGTQVIAVPNDGYHFLGWSDSITTVDRRDLDISENISVSAQFEQNNTVIVSSINPAEGYNTNSIELISIAGSGFMSGAIVKLTKAGESDVTCTGYSVSSNSITGGHCHISLVNTGLWTVKVTNPDTGSGILVEGFTVKEYEVATENIPNGPAGGFIYYINPDYNSESIENNWKYLEAGPVDLTIGTDWWDDYSTFMGATGITIGAGLSNTDIVVGETNPGNTNAIAYAYNYSLNGYTDWFLSSIDELNLMYTVLHNHSPAIGGFNSSGYWSSSEDTNTNAFRRSFGSTTSNSALKSQSYRVRPVRRFASNQTYTITYYGNGNTSGAVPVDGINYPEDTNVIVLEQGDLEKDGHKFIGWNTLADGLGTMYNEGENIYIDSNDVNLYAIWEVDFYIVILPDTQSLVNWKRSVVTNQIDWLINNKDILDIRFVSHVGDLVQEWDQDLTEWDFIQGEMGQLGVAGIPYSVLPGNHDYAQSTRNSTMFNSYFPLSTFYSMPTYGGAYDGNSDNTYHIINIADKNLLIMSLEFGPRDEVVAWANNILQINSNMKAIIITHAYINTDGNLLASGMDHAASNGYGLGSNVNDGDELWDELIYPNNNVSFVICGHDGTVTDGSALRESNHANGAPVHQFLSNYQYFQPLANGSYFLLINFTEGEVKVRTYSSYLNEYKTDGESQVDYNCSFLVN